MTSRYKTSYKSHRGSSRFHVSFDAARPQYPSKAACIQAQIKREEDFIRDHPNYTSLCEEARERIIFLQSELEAVGNPDLIDPVAAKESDAIQAQLSRDWNNIQEIPF